MLKRYLYDYKILWSSFEYLQLQKTVIFLNHKFTPVFLDKLNLVKPNIKVKLTSLDHIPK